ncbi:hypothetical protein PENSPDRAFT_665942 [Peniophora sp. CONT]|nr:hypothetical protein PENSPDRAFT_665942 [Peniophora sp. CONT]
MYPPIHNDVEFDSSFKGPCVEVAIAGEFSTDWNWDSFDVPPQVSEALLSTIPVASLKTLTLHAHHDKYLAHGPFGDLARRAPALETLTLVDYNAFELAALFERLGGNMQGKLDADKELKVILIVLAPRLRKLQLTRCDFGVNVAAPALRRAFERRAQAADKVEAIIFDDCLSGSARVEELKAELVREDLVRSFFNIGIEAGEEGSRMDG